MQKLTLKLRQDIGSGKSFVGYHEGAIDFAPYVCSSSFCASHRWLSRLSAVIIQALSTLHISRSPRDANMQHLQIRTRLCRIRHQARTSLHRPHPLPLSALRLGSPFIRLYSRTEHTRRAFAPVATAAAAAAETDVYIV